MYIIMYTCTCTYLHVHGECIRCKLFRNWRMSRLHNTRITNMVDYLNTTPDYPITQARDAVGETHLYFMKDIRRVHTHAYVYTHTHAYICICVHVHVYICI